MRKRVWNTHLFYLQRKSVISFTAVNLTQDEVNLYTLIFASIKIASGCFPPPPPTLALRIMEIAYDWSASSQDNGLVTQ